MVLVNGGAGSIGTYAIQLALAAGAEVDVADRGDKAGFLHDLGVSEVIDYQIDDFTRRSNSYELILDVIDKSSFPSAAPALVPGGTYLHSNLSPMAALRRRFYRAPDGRSSSFVTGKNEVRDLDYLASLVAAGELRSVIDRTFDLDDIVEAHRYAESGDKKGHVVVGIP